MRLKVARGVSTAKIRLGDDERYVEGQTKTKVR